MISNQQVCIGLLLTILNVCQAIDLFSIRGCRDVFPRVYDCPTLGEIEITLNGTGFINEMVKF